MPVFFTAFFNTKNGNNGHNKHSIMNIESTSAFAKFNFSFYKLVMKPVNNI